MLLDPLQTQMFSPSKDRPVGRPPTGKLWTVSGWSSCCPCTIGRESAIAAWLTKSVATVAITGHQIRRKRIADCDRRAEREFVGSVVIRLVDSDVASCEFTTHGITIVETDGNSVRSSGGVIVIHTHIESNHGSIF